MEKTYREELGIKNHEFFGIWWHCDNLMVSSHSKIFKEHSHIYWQATCTAMTLENNATLFEFDEFCEDKYWRIRGSNNGWNFRTNTQTCSKYKKLSWEREI